jgi:hypothetical protein
MIAASANFDAVNCQKGTMQIIWTDSGISKLRLRQRVLTKFSPN